MVKKNSTKTKVQPYEIGELDHYLFGQGNHYEIYKKMGAHEVTKNGKRGVYFAVWAPHAVNVSVIGEFNDWDETKDKMKRGEPLGIYTCFVPEAKKGDLYKFCIETQAGEKIYKADPFANYAELRPGTASRITDISNLNWSDSKWMTAREKWDNKEEPVSIYEVHMGSWMRHPGREDEGFYTYREFAEAITKYVKEMGYTHVELMGIAEHPFDGSWGYQVTGYYAPTARYGTPEDFAYMVNYLHKNNIGVILDWVPAHFPKDAHGLADFDGTPTFEYPDPRKGEHPDWGTKVFNYEKPEVSNFLLANALFWVEHYHVDGLRVDAVASMLYLDYGKKDGEWVANIYGGNENLDAIEFLKTMNKYIAKRGDGCFTIAEESSGWFGVTAADNDDPLMFTYKQNNCWTKDFLEFMGTDPLFRKGEYMVSGSDEKAHLSDIRAALGFMYAHPGSKMFAAGQDAGLEKFMSELNKFYAKNAALYELDNDPDGFMWLENSNPEETVIAMQRADSKGNKLVVAVNFTPVRRENYRLHVDVRGKYKEVFNSDWKKFGGDEKVNGQIIKSDNDGDDMEYIDITLPGLSFVIYNSEPYTQLELEEIAVLKRAAIAKKEAMKKAAEAEMLELAAAEEAKRAVEARKQAEKACMEALQAKEEAVRKAEEAAKAAEEAAAPAEEAPATEAAAE